MAIYRGPGGTGDSNRGESVEGPNSTIENLTGLIGPIRAPTYIEFDKTANHTPIVGQLTWNEQEGTLDVGLNTGVVTLQIGEEILYRVHNGSGVVIPDGTLVMATGTLGNSGRIVVAAYDGVSSPETIMGLATEEIGIGLEGYVTHFGKVRGIQTNGGNYGETWADGDIIYASNTGGLTNVRPEAPNTKTIIAIVINAHGSNGTLFVRVTPSSALSNDDLVEIGTLTNGDILVYNSTTSRFENVANTALQPGNNVSDLVNDAGYLTTETDPVYTGSSWYTTTNNSANWDTAYSWGDHASEGYLDAGDVGTTVLAYDSNLQSFVNTFTLPTVDGTANQVVATDGAGNLVFNTISGTGTVTSIDITAGTGISATGGPITTNGSITVTNTAPMTYPSAGIAVSTGSAWGTSKTTPTGNIVGTTDTQTLTNKTINGSNNTITNVSLSTGITGTLSVGNGGTGRTTLTSNNVLLGNGTSAVNFVAPGTSGNVLTSNGTTWTSAANIGRLINVQIFTSSGTYTPTTGTRAVEVEVIGGGGGGGGSNNTNQQAGGGGGGGGYSYKFITSGLGATEPVTIGAGGANGGTKSSGSAGGTSSFGSHCSASGGGAGSDGSSPGSPASGGTGTGGDINIAGGAGAPAGQIYAPRNSEGGHAPRGYGIGGKTNPNISGGDGIGYGAGGAGGWRINSNAPGGSGKAGIVIVKEYV